MTPSLEAPPACPPAFFVDRFGICARTRWCRAHPSGASGKHREAVSGPAQFELRTPGSESSGQLQGAPRSSGELREAPE
eukprot:13611897-Alexandrium_andersonii.AAC.1